MVSRTAPLQLAPGAGAQPPRRAGGPALRTPGLRRTRGRAHALVSWAIFLLISGAGPGCSPCRAPPAARRPARGRIWPPRRRNSAAASSCPGSPSSRQTPAGARVPALEGAARRPRPPGTQEPGRPLPDPTPGRACRPRPPAPTRAISGSPPSRDGAAPPAEPPATRAQGEMPGSGGGGGARSASRLLFSSRRAGSAGGVAPQVPLHRTRDPARRPPRGLRREEGPGRAAAGEAGTGGGRGSRGAAVTRARGPPSARGGVYTQPSSARAAAGPTQPAAGAGAFRRSP